MSIIPINDQQRNDFDPFSALDLWDPFSDFPFPSTLSNIFREFNLLGSSVNSRIDWRETRNVHILTASLPAFMDEDVLVELQDERFLQMSTDSGSFMTRVKLPDTAKIEELKAFLNNGVLTVTVPKTDSGRPNIRVIEISGDD